MPGRLSSKTKQRIKYLRQRGYSVPEIHREVKVSKHSVLKYVRGVEILPEFLSEWAGKRGGSRKIRLKKEKIALEEGRKLVSQLTYKEKLLLLSSLYWAEGCKKDFSLANTDPNLISVFVNCMRDVFGLKDEQFFINVRIYEDLDKEKCLDFWSKVVRIPQENMKGVNILHGKKKGKLEYGMCRVRIEKGGEILKKVKGVNQAVFENFAPIAQLDRASRS